MTTSAVVDGPVPTNAAELAEFMADPAKLRNLFDMDEEKGLTPKPAYAKFLAELADNELRNDAKIAAAVQTQMALGAKSDPTKVERKGLANGRASYYNQHAPGTKIDPIFNSFGEFFQACYWNTDSLPNGVELRDKKDQARKITNAMSSVIPADGGYLIPEELRAEVMRVALQESVTRARATVIPMASKTLGLPVVDESTTATSVRGGWVAYRTPESTAPTETNPKFGRVVLDATKLMVRTNVPNELVADAPGLQSFVMQGLPEVIRDGEERDFIGGSGVGAPLGWAHASNPALVSVTRNTDGFIWNDITSMFALMFASSHPNGAWVCSSEVLPALLRAVISTGNATIPVVGPALLLQDGQGIKSAAGSILGKPLLVSDHLAQTGSANDLMYVDLSYYLIGDRQGITMSSSSDVRFNEDETAYKVIARHDGRPWLLSSRTPPNGGDAQSAFVGRAA